MTKANQSKQSRLRIIFIGMFFTLFFCVVVFRSYQLQIIENVKLDRLVESQYQKKITFRPKRGTIYDRNGDVLAIDVEVASIGIHPKKITEKDKVQKLLSQYTNISRKDLTRKLNSQKSFEFIERRIPYENGQAILKEKLKGVRVEKEYRRFYPNKQMAGHLLGAVGYDAKALGGIELTYNDYLKTSLEKLSADKDARGKLFSWGKKEEDYHDLYLTIDKTIQHITEDALHEQARVHKVKKGFAMVVNAKTSEILAMANYPSFNPNVYWKYPLKKWKNRAVIDSFEPGSTFKTFVMAAALESGKVKAKDLFYCEKGALKIGKYTVKDHGKAYQNLSSHKILQVSSNIGMTKIAFHVGKKYIYDTLKKLKFGEKTNIGLGGEPSGILRNHKKWREIEFSNISFGQGVTVNGLQMVAAFASLANDGHYTAPSIVKKIEHSDGKTVFETKPKTQKNVFSKKTITDVKKMLFSVTQKDGTAPQAHLPGYLAGGKTGTAQVLDSQTKTYSDSKYISSFLGYAPLDNPDLVIYVVYETQKDNGYYGGVVAGPVFKTIAQKTLTYLGVLPENLQNDPLFDQQSLAQKP